MNKHLIVIAGPTAVGKTSLAIHLAAHLNTEIISADSRQLFREMNLGTAKPSAEELKAIPHHLINSHSIHEAYNVSMFEEDALRAISSVFKKTDTALLVGGSGLYIQAVCNGLDEMPAGDETLRRELKNLLEQQGIASLQKKLQALDPVYFRNADLQNPQRLMRAIEVCILSGKPYSLLRKKEKTKRPFRITKIALQCPRNELYMRINTRVEQMMEEGLLEEARQLYKFKHLPALQTTGYMELFEHFEGRITLPEAIEKIKQNTRRYAKRQLTWFRHDSDITWFGANDAEKILAFLLDQRNVPHIPV